MKRIRTILLIVGTVVAVNAVGSAEVFLRPQATGKGSFKTKTKTGKTDERQFSFSVQTNLDGTISGQASLVDPNAEGAAVAGPYALELDITCMHVVDNVAFFGGTTSRTSDPDLIDAAYFSVKDNGNGIDEISRVYFFDDDPDTNGDPQLCMENQPGDFLLEPLVSGNINLK